MEFMALDKDFQLVSLIVPSLVMWNRKYYEYGDFLVEVPYLQYNDEMKYIYTKDRREVGMIQKIAYQEEGQVKKVQLSGYFMEKILDDKVIYPTFYGSGPLITVLREMIPLYQDDLPFTLESGTLVGSTVTFQATGDELGKKVKELLQTQEISARLNYTYNTNEFALQFYRGLNRTQSQTTNNFVTFSTSWKNIINVVADRDTSNHKNYVIITGEGEAEERIVEYIDLTNGESKKMLYVDARDLRFDNEKQTIEQYREALRQRGLEKLLDYQSVENITFVPIPNSYNYLSDYDLGTKCDIIINDIGLTMEARIIAIYEVFKEGAHTVELEFGNKVLSRLDKIERKVQ